MELTQQEKINLSTTEISKRIKQELKKFKGCKFSVSSDYYSGGSSISINLMESNFKVIRDFKDIQEVTLFELENRNYPREDIKTRQEGKYHQLNQYTLKEDFKPTVWCNGVFLTEQGYNLFKRVVEIANQYNYNNSDTQIDYFDVNFYLHLNIGKWNKEFIEVV